MRRAHMARAMLQALWLPVIGALFLLAAPGAMAQAKHKRPRFPILKVSELTPQQRPLADRVLKVSSVGLAGPYNLMLRSPVLGERMFDMLNYLRFHTSVPRSLNEFAILIQARLWSSPLEWGAHYPLALKAGLPKAVADQLNTGKRPTSMTPEQAAVYDFCMAISSRRTVSDATFRRLRKYFSPQQVVDLTFLSGTYASLAMLLKMSDQGLPPGRKSTLDPLPAR